MANLYNNTNTNNNAQFNPSFLSQNQQDLLMAALQSQSNQPDVAADALSNRDSVDFSSASLDPSILTNQPDGLYNDLDFNSFNDQQLFDFLDNNNQSLDMDYDQNDNENSPEENSPEASTNVDPGEKRKSMADDKDYENGAKRREGDEKQAKKPGRKPLTSEPTSKRKAQNRAAQRAFRERKEKHLRDLETKVSELEKNTESANHENGMLRAQVERLQMELREYRKRLSTQSTLGRSPQSASMGSFSNDAVNSFSFDFPRSTSVASLSSIPYSNMPLFGNGSMQTSPNSASVDFGSSGFLTRQGSTDATSPSSINANTPASSDMRSQQGSTNKDSPKPFFGQGILNNGMNSRASDSPIVYNIFGGSSISAEPESVNSNANLDPGAQSRGVFQFNSNNTSSPSASTSSQYGGNGGSSSAGTSPEPTTGINKESNTLETINESKQRSEFMDQLGLACGNTSNPEPRSKSISDGTSAPTTETLTANSNPFQLPDTSVDIFSASWPDQSESSNNYTTDGSMGAGYFSEPSALFAMASPMDWNDLTGSMRTGLTPAQQKSNPFEMSNPMPKIKEEEMVVPADGQMISCNKIWDKIQQRPDFKDGSLDIDGLCSELRKKAKCSETGVVIDKNDVDAALQRLPGMR